MTTRSHHIREIIGHLDALIDDLDGTGTTCGARRMRRREDDAAYAARNKAKEN